MFSKTIFAIGALAMTANAVPFGKRDIVYNTETSMVFETVAITTTVWVDAPTATEALGSLSSVYMAPNSTQLGNSTQVANATTSTFNLANTTSTVYDFAPSTSAVEFIPTPATTDEVQPEVTSVYVAPAPPATEEYVAPAPATTEEYVAPAPTEEPTPTSAAPVAPVYEAPAETSPSTNENSAASGEVYTGDITWYDPGLGSCGETHGASEDIVALPHGIMTPQNGANPNNNPLCGSMITITYNGASHQAEVVDTCGGCEGGSIDLSPTLFEKVAPNGDGRVSGVSWSFN